MITVSETRDHELIGRLSMEVQNLHATMYPEIFKPFDQEGITKVIQEYLKDANCKAYVAIKNGIEIGCAIFMVKEAKENAFHYNIRSVYVDQISVLSSHRRSGAGMLLLEQAEKMAKELNINRLELDHWSANTVAATAFRKNGYSPCKERLFKIID